MGGILQSLLASFPTGVAGYFLYGWGRNNNGGLGDQTIVTKSSPVQIGALDDWLVLSAGTYETSSVKTDGTLWTWGNNTIGQLGHGDIVARSSPVQVGALTNWITTSISSNVSDGGGGGCVSLKDDGTLWAWGAYGVSGQNVSNPRSSPVQIGSDTNWASAFVGEGACFAIKTTGALYAWGNNGFGKLGVGQALSNLRSPVQVGALTTWASIGQGSIHTLALKTDGTMWAWGRSVNGELGQNNRVDRSSPVQVGALTTWASVEGGQFSSAAINNSNQLWTWGWNFYGWLGLGDRVARSSPVQVSGSGWLKVAAGRDNTMAVKTDGQLWAIGGGSYGALGLGNNTNRSTPIQVGSDTNWETISSNLGARFMALKG